MAKRNHFAKSDHSDVVELITKKSETQKAPPKKEEKPKKRVVRDWTGQRFLV